jgi:hypothetical protein
MFANTKKVFTTFAQIQGIKPHFPFGVLVGKGNAYNHCHNKCLF